jgi:glycosyltransferase involved in cell wall biosynthesis
VPDTQPPLICFSHLAWDHVFQRPHHLMTAAACDRRVLFVEEPRADESPGIRAERRGSITVVTPAHPAGLTEAATTAWLADAFGRFLRREGVDRPVLWYETPMALPWTGGVDAVAVAYDVMDELSAFRGAPPALVRLERELLRRADVVFTGGRSLYEAKRSLHPNVHEFPSAVDLAHFRRARTTTIEPSDQAAIPRPRIGYFGVIDERLDLALLDELAARRPDWSVVLVGPLAKIAEDDLPRRPNLHVLGQRQYDELPDYLAGWDVAIMPFALNEATRYISPTKTPEYLAGGRPVVSTPIRDVVSPYGERGLVRIADGPTAFVAACEAALDEPAGARTEAADRFLAGRTWTATWAAMDRQLERVRRRGSETASGLVAAVTGARAAASLGGMTAGAAAAGSAGVRAGGEG